MGNPWLAHVKATMKKHPGKEFKEVLKLAKQTYKKVQSVVVGKKKKSRKSRKTKKGKKPSRKGKGKKRKTRKTKRRMKVPKKGGLCTVYPNAPGC